MNRRNFFAKAAAFVAGCAVAVKAPQTRVGWRQVAEVNWKIEHGVTVINFKGDKSPVFDEKLNRHILHDFIRCHHG